MPQQSLSPISAPTLVIWGERDSYLGPELAEPDRDDVPNLDRVERLADASHWVHHDEAEHVNQLLIDFFAAAAAAGPAPKGWRPGASSCGSHSREVRVTPPSVAFVLGRLASRKREGAGHKAHGLRFPESGPHAAMRSTSRAQKRGRMAGGCRSSTSVVWTASSPPQSTQ